jgi:hypothetical protein
MARACNRSYGFASVAGQIGGGLFFSVAAEGANAARHAQAYRDSIAVVATLFAACIVIAALMSGSAHRRR